MLIELMPRDLFIAEYIDKKTGNKNKVVRLRSNVAFDEDFIEEMKLKGVKEVIEQEEADEE